MQSEKIYPLIKKKQQANVKALIRPIITYAPSMVTPLYKCPPALEVFQNKCMRLIHNAPRHTNTQHLRNISELPTIKEFISIQTEKFFVRTPNKLIKTPNVNDTRSIQHKQI
ncbi:unnamed protein product [Tenebrio molitor]|nr:unnamed protein product [Tenebrio molitor]